MIFLSPLHVGCFLNVMMNDAFLVRRMDRLGIIDIIPLQLLIPLPVMKQNNITSSISIFVKIRHQICKVFLLGRRKGEYKSREKVINTLPSPIKIEDHLMCYKLERPFF